MASDDVIQKIQKLLNMTVDNGCTPAEAAHAAAKAQEFMQRHGLSLFDVKSKSYGEEVVQEERTLNVQRIQAWVYDMAGAVSRPNGCQAIFSWTKRFGKKFHVLKFIGHATDAKVVSYLYESLSAALWKQSAKAGWINARSGAKLAKFRWDFMRGAAWEIETRLQAANRKMEQLGNAVPVPCGDASEAVSGEVYGAMVLVKGKAVQTYMAEHYPNVREVKVGGRSPLDGDAVDAGRRAGREIPLRQGVESCPQGLLR